MLQRTTSPLREIVRMALPLVMLGACDLLNVSAPEANLDGLINVEGGQPCMTAGEVQTGACSEVAPNTFEYQYCVCTDDLEWSCAQVPCEADQVGQAPAPPSTGPTGGGPGQGPGPTGGPCMAGEAWYDDAQQADCFCNNFGIAECYGVNPDGACDPNTDPGYPTPCGYCSCVWDGTGANATWDCYEDPNCNGTGPGQCTPDETGSTRPAADWAPPCSVERCNCYEHADGFVDCWWEMGYDEACGPIGHGQTCPVSKVEPWSGFYNPDRLPGPCGEGEWCTCADNSGTGDFIWDCYTENNWCGNGIDWGLPCSDAEIGTSGTTAWGGVCKCFPGPNGYPEWTDCQSV